MNLNIIPTRDEKKILGAQRVYLGKLWLMGGRKSVFQNSI